MAGKWVLGVILVVTWMAMVNSNYATATSSSSSSSSPESLPSSSSTSSSSSNAAAKDEDFPPSGSDTPFPPVSQDPETLSSMGSMIPGIYKEYLPQPIFYETVAPAIYQYQTPQWNKTEITFNNWYTCVTETVPYRYSCPVTFHMNKAIVNLHVDFEGLHPIGDVRAQGIQDSMKSYYERLTSHSEFCDRIQKHFAGIWTETADLQRYLTALQGCSRGSELHPYIEKSIIDYNYSIRQPFTKMENNFYNTFYKHILGSGGKNMSLDLVASALLSNTRTSLQGAILGQYYAEKSRWVHANQDCREGIIPTSLVTPDKLNQSLTSILKMSLFRHEYDLSISPGQMSKYYSLPLTDCTHTTDNFIVRVQVPILKKFRGEVLQLVHVHSIPFQFKDHICKVKLPGSENNPNTFKSEIDSASMFLYHAMTQRAYRTTCKPNQLCKISEYLLDIRRSDPCVSSLLSSNDTGIRQFCNFECLPKDDYVLPVVVRVSANKFVVTGSPLSLRITCGRLISKEKLIHIPQDHVGAMLVKLSCRCRLIVPHFNVYFGGNTCEKEEDIFDEQPEANYEPEVEISSIIPFMFAKLKDKGNSHNLGRTANSVNHHRDDDFYDGAGDHKALNLTELIDMDRIENYIRASEIRRQNEQKKFKGMDFYAEKLQGGESSGGGLGGLFWTVFILSLIVILSLQIYIIIYFKRYERVSYSTHDSILYRVEPDTASLG